MTKNKWENGITNTRHSVSFLHSVVIYRYDQKSSGLLCGGGLGEEGEFMGKENVIIKNCRVDIHIIYVSLHLLDLVVFSSDLFIFSEERKSRKNPFKTPKIWACRY